MMPVQEAMSLLLVSSLTLKVVHDYLEGLCARITGLALEYLLKPE